MLAPRQNPGDSPTTQNQPMSACRRVPQDASPGGNSWNQHSAPRALRTVRFAGVAANDVFDALVALWTAQWIASGTARTISTVPPCR